MNTQTIIEKCQNIPGVSISTDTHSLQLHLNTPDGTGTMTFCPLFPGITLAYISVHASCWPAPDIAGEADSGKGPLIINYCIGGRCELMLNNDSYVYITEHQLSLTERFAQEQYIYPGRHYHGMEFFIDLDMTCEKSPFLSEYFCLNLKQLSTSFCPSGNTYIAPASRQTDRLFQSLWQYEAATKPDTDFQRRNLSLQIFHALLNKPQDISPKPCTFYTKSQAAIAKETEAILTGNLQAHPSAKELAARFSVSETSLKNYFRGIYGQNLSDYMREYRMKRAAELLSSTHDSVNRISEQVGYLNQSKFAAVFKKQFGLSPLEYRRIYTNKVTISD